MRRKLSYANVMATLAVFVALGGTGYAVTQINGSQIRDRSIPGKKLKVGAVTAREINPSKLVVPRALLSDQTRSLIVSRRPSGKRAHDVASGGTSTIITLSVGQSATVIQSGPFSYVANCTAGGNGQPLVDIQAVSTEAGSLIQGAFDSSGHLLFPEPYPLTPGQPVYASGAPASTAWSFLINGARMLAPSGAALTVNLSYGTNMFGAQCWSSGYGVT